MQSPQPEGYQIIWEKKHGSGRDISSGRPMARHSQLPRWGEDRLRHIRLPPTEISGDITAVVLHSGKRGSVQSRSTIALDSTPISAKRPSTWKTNPLGPETTTWFATNTSASECRQVRRRNRGRKQRLQHVVETENE